jgi:hypothetical protein
MKTDKGKFLSNNADLSDLGALNDSAEYNFKQLANFIEKRAEELFEK